MQKIKHSKDYLAPLLINCADLKTTDPSLNLNSCIQYFGLMIQRKETNKEIVQKINHQEITFFSIDIN